MAEGLVDGHGRNHRSLRVSVTDRCNIRCSYCMPLVNARFLPRREILRFEEITRFVRVAGGLGINRVRITGGEPLLRNDLPKLIAQLADLDGIDDLALTTNGILLPRYAEALRAAGLQRLNISLDAVSESAFQRIARRKGVHRVFEGVAAAKSAGFQKIRLNAVSLRGITEDEVVPLAEYARAEDLELRFIEFMPLDAEQNWETDEVLTGAEVKAILEKTFGPLRPAPRPDPSQPARDYWFADGRGGIGLISSISEPFCGDCDRLRLTAEGKIHNCLFSAEGWDARRLMRSGASDEAIADLVRRCIEAKKAGHGVDDPRYLERPDQAMFQIGG